MKTKLFFVVVLFFYSFISYSQENYKGRVIDIESEELLAFVNIGVIGKSIGTVSDINGDFELTLDEKNDRDTLRISMIGYEYREYIVSDFKKEILENSTVKLIRAINELDEIVVVYKNLKEKILGSKTTSKVITGGFTKDALGSEVGIKIKIKKSPTYIDDFNVSITHNAHDTIRFRLNFYDVKNGLPNNNILKENIIVKTNMKEGVLTVDLRKYNIVMEDDFIVTLEWLEDLGIDGLRFSMGFLGKAIIHRSTSQAKWEKTRGITIGFNVTARY